MSSAAQQRDAVQSQIWKIANIYSVSMQQTISAASKDGALSSMQQILSAASNPFKLGWAHYQILMRIKNAQERRFYEIEAINQQWTYKQLLRQYNSSLYERLALSCDKEDVMRLAAEGQKIEKPTDVLKNPFVNVSR